MRTQQYPMNDRERAIPARTWLFWLAFSLIAGASYASGNYDHKYTIVAPTFTAAEIVTTTNSGPYITSPRTKTASCAYRDGLPDPACTPGAISIRDTTAICAPGYATAARDVPLAVWYQGWQEYGIKTHTAATWEMDHLIPLELGGSNDLANLWPQPAASYHDKDATENALHDAVCSGKMSLAAAQRRMSEDWRKP